MIVLITITEPFNNYVDVSFDLPSTVLCHFYTQNESTTSLSCNISYGSSCFDLKFGGQRKAVIDKTVFIELMPQNYILQEFCFLVTASNGLHTLTIQGRTSTGILQTEIKL